MHTNIYAQHISAHSLAPFGKLHQLICDRTTNIFLGLII